MCIHTCGSQGKTEESVCFLISWDLGVELWLSGLAASNSSEPSHQLSVLFFFFFLCHLSLSLFLYITDHIFFTSKNRVPQLIATWGQYCWFLCFFLLVISHKSFPTSHSKPPLGSPYLIGRKLESHPCLCSVLHCFPHTVPMIPVIQFYASLSF